MYEVAEWISENLEFDRMYLYGEDFPIHISYGEENSKVMYLMRSKNSKLIPKKQIKKI